MEVSGRFVFAVHCLFEVWGSVLLRSKPARTKVWCVQAYVLISILLTSGFPLSGIRHFLFDLAPCFFFFWACLSLWFLNMQCSTMCYCYVLDLKRGKCESVCVCVWAWENRCVFSFGECVFVVYILAWWPVCVFMCFSSNLLHLIRQDKRAAHMGQPPHCCCQPFCRQLSFHQLICSSVHTFLTSLIISPLVTYFLLC